jgi:hypothetical protein
MATFSNNILQVFKPANCLSGSYKIILKATVQYDARYLEDTWIKDIPVQCAYDSDPFSLVISNFNTPIYLTASS